MKYDIPLLKSLMPDYKLVEVLGVGGEGIVFKGQHRESKRMVAIKF